ncbi:MAG: hypothetical protein ABSB82_01655 [Terriglobia bacterium]|jgi:hypothetical protein
MKLSFLPGKLSLQTLEGGTFQVSVDSREILLTRSQKAAVNKFNELRQEMESQFPVREFSDAEKAQTFQRIMADALVQHNSLGRRKKKTTAGSTRTFGG